MSTLKKRRRRRTKNEIEDLFFNSAKVIIEEIGFTNLTLSKLMQHANAEARVFYKRYKDLDDFLDKFVREYDYWVADNILLDSNDDPIQNYKDIAINLIDSFSQNKIMQKLIAWEMSEENTITKRSASNRDANSQHLIKYFSQEFENSTSNFNYVTAIIIGGIYYIIGHKNVGTINNIDFNKPEAIDLLKDNILIMIDKIFGDIRKPESDSEIIDNERTRIAAEMLKDNISKDSIKRITKMSDKELKIIAKMINSDS